MAAGAAAAVGGVGLQVIRDWVLRFNAEGPGGLIDRKAPGKAPTLDDAQRQALAAAVGLAVSGMVLRFGLGAESLAWIPIFAVAPLSGIYYPIATLPEWVQPAALVFPSAYVFEGMRSVLVDGMFRVDHLAYAMGLYVAYLVAGAGVFLYSFHIARRRGLLLLMGE